MSFFSHLECSVPCGAPARDPRERHFVCSCGAPLLARYDLDKARGWSRDSLKGRDASMWRYREMLPIYDGDLYSPLTIRLGLTIYDLLGNAGTTPIGITPFHHHDGVDELFLRSLGSRPTTALG